MLVFVLCIGAAAVIIGVLTVARAAFASQGGTIGDLMSGIQDHITSFGPLGALFAAIRGRLGRGSLRGVHLERGDEIRIAGSRSNVILDGELFEANNERPIVLRPTPPVPFLRLAA